MWRTVSFLACLACAPAALAAPSAHQPQLMRVELAGASGNAASGRLLLFATPLAQARKHAKHGKVTSIDTSPFEPDRVAVAAQEVHHLAPGHAVTVDTGLMAFPRPFAQLKPGRYDVQAVLDVNHDYNYSGRGAGDMVSPVTTITLDGQGSAIPTLKLTRTLPDTPIWSVPSRVNDAAAMRKSYALARKHSDNVDFVSADLTAFWGRSIHMHALVVKPPGYATHPKRHYPTVYWTHGFGGTLHYMTYTAAKVYGLMKSGKMPPMIWVLLDESSPTGTVEFADSVNNGPWGTALTQELIPHLESTYRMDADVEGRFLNGHSSGGWATLWLQTRYPKIFGGTWSTSPDPSDFHDFTGPNLYAAHGNVYHKADGKPWPLVRMHGKVIATYEQFARLERVLGPYGGQMASFEWVFSPRGKDGRPQKMFNRDTGAVNPRVVKYWRDHYDIAHRLQAHWSQLEPYLNGKIHLYVGTADTFYLNGAAHKLKAVLDGLHARSDIRFLPGKTHFDLYAKGKDRDWLLKQIAWQMYHVARPRAKLPKMASSL